MTGQMRRSVHASSTQLRHRQHLEQLIVAHGAGRRGRESYRHNVAAFILYVASKANIGPRDASDSFAMPPSAPWSSSPIPGFSFNCQRNNYDNDIRDEPLPAGETAVRKIPLPSPCSILGETSPIDVEVFDRAGFSAMDPIACGSDVDFSPSAAGRLSAALTATPLRGAATSGSPRRCRRSSGRTSCRGRRAG